MRILLISNQLDYSGAPIALLALARELLRQHHSVHLVALERGPLGTDFGSAGVQPLGHSTEDFDLYVANTVESVPTALAISRSSDQVLAWIHESAWFLRSQNVTPEKLSLHLLRFAAFPSRFQIDEFRHKMPTAVLMQLRNRVSIASAVPSPEVDRYFVCSGMWEARKAQPRLLELMRQVDSDTPIVFMGATRPTSMPKTRHIFTGQVPPAKAHAIIAASRGVLSAAVAETQNLVAIEAMQARRPVLLSDIPAHRELMELVPDVILFDPREAASFASGYAKLRAQWDDEGARERLQRNALRAFGPDAFEANVRSVLERVQGFAG